ncbi:putative RND superfamily exporter protein [Paraburkholderia sp. EB58]|jgi:predicted RND superfamily exporter protein|uniref:efflux RND transporter permease subunit n=1 Tax=Paraburkholderia sp. EB58 TaxID=3035125 RepID=UPI003D2144B8
MNQFDRTESSAEQAVTRRLEEFDPRSGNVLERLIFNNRLAIVLISLLLTALLGSQAIRLKVHASFEKTLAQSQPFIRNYLDNRNIARGLGNTVRIVVENKNGDIYDPEYLRTLREINDAVFLMPGVDRLFMKSLWTPSVRWTQITEEGYRGGAVMPQDYTGSNASLNQLKRNVMLAGIVGSVVSNDQHSSMIVVPLIEKNAVTGEPLDYEAFSRDLDKQVLSHQSDRIGIHITGFARLVGDLIDGIGKMSRYFVVAAMVAAAAILFYTRCVRSTVLVLVCSLTAVVWQLGIVNLLGFSLDPYSVLVPFLVFAIGVSHGAQKMNGIMQDVGRGMHKYVAARYTFRRLFLAGLTALLADAVGFGILTIIDIPVIRDLAMTASIGVGLLIFTNLVLLPVVLSFTGVSRAAANRSLRAQQLSVEKPVFTDRLWSFLDRFTTRRWAAGALIVAAGLTVAGFVIGLNLQTGDLDPGAPELRTDSRYNRDNAFISRKFGLSSDVFAVIVKTKPDGMSSFPTLTEEDRLEQQLRALPFVQGTMSAADMARYGTSGINEGSPKWFTLSRQASLSSQATFDLKTNDPELMNADSAAGTVIAYLADHRASTLDQVVKVTESFAQSHSNGDRQFLLAAGSAGIEAATNIAVLQANERMLAFVYAAVILLCLITFRSWRATIVAVIPLVVTSVLCQALMVVLGIGVKIATLPVVALGVGIGVDYALYLLSVQLAQQRAGMDLPSAYRMAVGFTGKVVALVGVTLAAGVVTWAWSPIKFQADMGILLTFMFIWNMVGALILIPSLSHFLLRNVSVRAVEKKTRRKLGSEEHVRA